MCISPCFLLLSFFFLNKRNNEHPSFGKLCSCLSECVGVVAAVSLRAHDITDVTRCIRPSIKERRTTRRALAKLKYRE